ncbi:MAG: TPM domain-containing protein [Solobacterium sp.]|nr:TPM domain-containing protein [Solobacterium sp.]
MRKLKLFSLSAILSMILFLLALPVPAKAANAYVIDEAGMLTTDELLALNNLAEEISLRQECGVYVIITKDMHGYSESKFAQGIFTNYDLGYDRGDS